MKLADLSEDRRAAVEAALQPGEAVRWIGLPDPSRSAAGGPGFTLAYVWLAVTGLWQAGALAAAVRLGFGPAWFYVAVGGVFIAIGVLFYLRALRESREARRIVHVITDRRLVTLDLAHPGRSLAIGADEIGYAEPATRPGGAGDIEVGHGPAGVDARSAAAFHHLRGVGNVNGAIKALRLMVADTGRSLVTEAPEN